MRLGGKIKLFLTGSGLTGPLSPHSLQSFAKKCAIHPSLNEIKTICPSLKNRLSVLRKL